MRLDNSNTSLVREDAGDERLEQERNEEGGGETISTKILGQNSLHGISFKELRESHLTVPSKLLAFDASEAEAIQHQSRHEERGGHVKADIEHAGDDVQDQVSRLSL